MHDRDFSSKYSVISSNRNVIELPGEVGSEVKKSQEKTVGKISSNSKETLEKEKPYKSKVVHSNQR
jgi:hypothetical protein